MTVASGEDVNVPYRDPERRVLTESVQGVSRVPSELSPAPTQSTSESAFQRRSAATKQKNTKISRDKNSVCKCGVTHIMCTYTQMHTRYAHAHTYEHIVNPSEDHFGGN